MIPRLLLAFMFTSLFISGVSEEKMGIEEEASFAIPTYLYFILSKEAWKKSVQENKLFLGPENNLFIHLSTEEQIPRIAEKFFKGIDYVVLKIETNKMQGRLAYETNPGGSNKYFHLYEGVIPLESVEAVTEKK